MPTIAPNSKVLVSGANGFLAAWVVRTLLEKGYSVRGTVRSEKKGQHLKEIFKEYEGKLETIIVKDITEDGAFDEAVKGVDAIEHISSPFVTDAKTPDELIIPAVQGTVRMLESALNFGTSVKRIVITSSTAAILQTAPHPQVFTEKNWDEQAIEQAQDPETASGWVIYRASKTLAEKAAWKFVEEHKDIGWDLTVLNPPFIFGPVIHSVSKPEHLNTSVKDWYDTLCTPTANGRSTAELATVGSEWVDVRDLAEAHVKVLETEKAGGKRMLISAGLFKWQDWADIVNALPTATLSSLAHKTTVGNPGSGSCRPDTVHMNTYDISLSKEILGLKYRTKEESAKDMIEDFAKRGW